MRDDFERILCHPGARGLYESNYVKANEPRGRGAVWIKYNLMAPEEPALPRSAELWAVVWRRAGERPVVVRQVVVEGQGAIITSQGSVEVRTDLASLTGSRARGLLESSGHRVGWDLALEGRETPIFHNAHAVMYRLPFPSKKLMTPRPRLEMTGRLEVDGEVVEVDRWVGLRGHNWGSAHPHSYAYCNANLWDQPGRWAFDGYSGRILLGSFASPWLSAGVLSLPSGELRLNGLRRLLNQTARVDFPSWTCTLRGQGAELRLRCTMDPEDVAGLRYLSPNGRLSYCYNTKFAALELLLRRRGRKTVRRTSRHAELEFLSPAPIPGIPLHGEDVLPS